MLSEAQAKSQLEDLEKHANLRRFLRSTNAQENITILRQQIERGNIKLRSDIKKSTAFVKKLKMFSENIADSVCKDIEELNLTRYVSECVASLAEVPLKMADVPTAMKVISLLHQRYEEFGEQMVETFINTFDMCYGAEDKSKLVKRRIILRLLCEMYLIDIFNDASLILSMIQRVARKEGGVPGSRSVKGGGSSLRSSGRAASLNAASSSSQQLEVPLLVSFAKSVGVEFIGVLPKRYSEMETLCGDSYRTYITARDNIVPSDIQAEFLSCLLDSYQTICKIYLAQHAALMKLRARNEKEEVNRGEVSEQHELELKNANNLYEKLQASVVTLSDVLDQEVPSLPAGKSENDGNGDGLLVWEGENSRGNGAVNGPFDDEDTRSFYEDLPDLLELVPAVVLGLCEADLAELRKKREQGIETTPDDDIDEDMPTDEPGELMKTLTDGHENGSDEADDEDQMVEMESDDKANPVTVDGSASSSSTTYHHQVDAYFSSLESICNRDRCDKAAVEFCYRNSKANRNRLIKTLFMVPRTHLELLAYYARLVATLQSVLKDDIGGELVSMLEAEFNNLIRKRNQFRLESKIKNIRFLAELVKFKICPPNVAFRCLKKCLNDFQGHNVHVATTFLETCGRFLYYSKHTVARTEAFLSIMLKLKSAKHLDPQAETLVDNAYYMCKPPQRIERAVKSYDPMYLYILKVLYNDLDSKNGNKIIKVLRKLHWDNPQHVAYVVKAISKVSKRKVMHLKLVCDVVKVITRYHDDLAIRLVDDLLEKIKCSLEANDPRERQNSIGMMKFLGEMFNSSIVNMNIILDTLYLLINHSHDLLTLPQYGGPGSTTNEDSIGQISPTKLAELKERFSLIPELRYDPRVPAEVDGTTDVFRIRLVCTLLETCQNGSDNSSGSRSSSGGLSKTRLFRFMVFFQRYIFSKSEIPMETDFLISDMFQRLSVTLKDLNFRQFANWEEADLNVQEILRTDLIEAERVLNNRKAKANASKNSASNSSGVLPEIEENEEDDDEDDDDDDDEDDDDDDKEHVSHRSVNDEDEEDDEVDDDDDDDVDSDEEDDDEDDGDSSDEDDEDDEEEEEEEEQFIIRDSHIQKSEEDDVFEREFKAMMMNNSGGDTRKQIARVNIDKMAIPAVVKTSTGSVSTISSLSVNSNSVKEHSDESTPAKKVGVVYQMLRRGNKGKVEARQLVVPEESSLAQHSHRQEHAGKKEMSEVKRLVLQNIEREDFFSSSPTGLDSAGIFGVDASTSEYLGSSNAALRPGNFPPLGSTVTNPNDLQTSTSTGRPFYQQHQHPPPPKVAGYGGGSEWNNAEFGLKRGKGYRGPKK